MEHPRTLQEAIIFFADKDNAFNYFVSRRWPNGVICPNCGRTDVVFLANQKKWQCKSTHPKRQFTAKVGTIFEDSPLGLDKWLMVVWMIINCKNGISSYEVHRHIGVTQKTAWFMVHRIRLAMTTGTFEKLSGTVEADETYIGGDAKNMHKDKRERFKMKGGRRDHKTGVLGMLERKGRVRAKVVNAARGIDLIPVVRNTVEEGSELFTDSLQAYDLLNTDYIHEAVNHSVEYVRGHIHTNGIENFWSLLKRTIKGTYVSVDAYHLQKYVEEQVFRYNERKGTDAQRFSKITGQMAGKRLTYADLTGKTPSAYKLSKAH